MGLGQWYIKCRVSTLPRRRLGKWHQYSVNAAGDLGVQQAPVTHEAACQNRNLSTPEDPPLS